MDTLVQPAVARQEAAVAEPCRQCGSRRLTDQGPLPRRGTFAGQSLDAPLDGGHLYSCENCSLTFRSPILTEEQYESLYSRLPATVWVRSHPRADQLHVLDALARYTPGGSVLDVGCYDGFLLSKLGAAYSKFGIEASVQAAEVAAGRGVNMIGQYISELGQVPESFDAITCVDVIEHVANPLDLLKTLKSKLKPGGCLLVSTGDSSALAWRWLGGHFWYCANLEHLSFINRAWCEKAAASEGLTLAEVTHFRYDFDAGGALASYAKLLYEVAGMFALSTASRLGIAPVTHKRGVGRQGLFKDHLVAVFRKPVE